MSDAEAPRPVSASRRATEVFDTFMGGPARVRPRPQTTPPILELQNVSASYGPFRSLLEVSFRLWPGRATALLGSNGAGKTTVARVCSGLVKPDDRSIFYDGMDVTGFAGWEFAQMGITHVAEGRSVFGTLTVEENLNLAFRRLVGADGTREALEKAYEMFPVLKGRRSQLAGTLSGGQQGMLSLARAFPDPRRLLTADELSLGLAPLVIDEVFEALVHLRDAGTPPLIIEQHVERALEMAEQVILIQKGRIMYDGPRTNMGDALELVLPSTRQGS